jgi:hypothetical protein
MLIDVLLLVDGRDPLRHKTCRLKMVERKKIPILAVMQLGTSGFI